MYKQKASELLQAQIKQRSKINQPCASSSISSFIASQPLSTATDAANIASSLTVEGKISTKRKDILSLCFDKPRSSNSIDEFTSWMSSTLTLDDDESDDILRFWSQYEHIFPTVAAIARDILAITASNTTVERLFSRSKAMVTDKRTNIGVEKIDRLLFLRKNLDIFKKVFDQHPNDGEQQQIKRKVNQQTNEVLDTNSKKSKTRENDEITSEEEEVGEKENVLD